MFIQETVIILSNSGIELVSVRRNVRLFRAHIEP